MRHGPPWSASSVIAAVQAKLIGRIRALVKKSLPRQDWLNINDAVLEVIALARSEMNMNRVSLQNSTRGLICRPYAQIEFSFNK